MQPYICEDCRKETKEPVNVGDHIYCPKCISKGGLVNMIPCGNCYQDPNWECDVCNSTGFIKKG
jgi:hypothetical protein